MIFKFFSCLSFLSFVESTTAISCTTRHAMRSPFYTGSFSSCEGVVWGTPEPALAVKGAWCQWHLFQQLSGFFHTLCGCQNDTLFSSFLVFFNSWPNRRTTDVSVIVTMALQTRTGIATSLLEGQIHACFVLSLRSRPIASSNKRGDIFLSM